MHTNSAKASIEVKNVKICIKVNWKTERESEKGRKRDRDRSDWRQNEDVTMAILTLHPIFKSIRMIKLWYYLNGNCEKRNGIQFQYVNTTKWHRL